MNQSFRYFLIISIVAATVSSCKSKAPKEAKYIPKDASFVLVVDPQLMQDKLQNGGISMDTLLKRVFKNDSLDSKDKAFFNELRMNAGMNWGEKIFLFMLQKANPDNSQSNAFSLLASLQDASKMETFLKNQAATKDKAIKKESNYSYLINEEGSMLAWNDKQVIATMYTHALKPFYDTIAMTYKRPGIANIEVEMKKQVGEYFSQKESESLASVEKFTDMFKEKADGYAFANANSSLAALSMMPIQLPKMEELIKDNFVASTLSFENGKIVATSNSYTNPLLSSVLKQYAGPTVNLTMLENYPSDNINAIMLASFNPEIFGGILKQLEVEGLVNNFLENMGISSQDIYKSLKGDIAVIISDLSMGQSEPQMKIDEKSMLSKKRFGKMIFNATIGDKVSFHKLMDKAVEKGMLVKQNNIYKAAGSFSVMGLYMMADDNNFMIASDSLTYAQYALKKNKAVISNDALNRFKGKSTVFYVDIANTLKGFRNDSNGSYDNSLKTAIKTFKDVMASSDNFDGKSVKGAFEIRMQNEKQNSLVTLTSLITDIAVDMRVQARKEKEMEEKLFPGGVPAIIRTN